MISTVKHLDFYRMEWDGSHYILCEYRRGKFKLTNIYKEIEVYLFIYCLSNAMYKVLT